MVRYAPKSMTAEQYDAIVKKKKNKEKQQNKE
jgi:hypothetical protein